MRHILPMLLVGLAIALPACNMITYEGEFNQDGFYRSNSQVYFDITQPSDTLRSFAFADYNGQRDSYTFEIPIKLMGHIPTKDLQVRVAVDAERTTATEGVHYTALPEYVVIPAGAVNGMVRLTVLRAALPSDRDETYSVVLHLESTDDAKVAFEDKNTVQLDFNNFLDFSYLESMWHNYIGPAVRVPYSRTFVLKMLEYYNYEKKEFESTLWSPLFFTNFGRAVAYFKAHPDPDVDVSQEIPSFADAPYKD